HREREEGGSMTDGSAQDAGATGPAPGAGVRVILADDQALLRGAFRTLLDSADDITVVGEAGDGREAVALARRLRPDVVLMDIQMPVMDGLAGPSACPPRPRGAARCARASAPARRAARGRRR